MRAVMGFQPGASAVPIPYPIMGTSQTPPKHLIRGTLDSPQGPRRGARTGLCGEFPEAVSPRSSAKHANVPNVPSDRRNPYACVRRRACVWTFWNVWVHRVLISLFLFFFYIDTAKSRQRAVPNLQIRRNKLETSGDGAALLNLRLISHNTANELIRAPEKSGTKLGTFRAFQRNCPR